MARVGVIGAGAVGCYYGALLARAGHEVHFLLRRDYNAIRKNGLTIRSPRGDFRLDEVRCHIDPSTIGVCDLVLCALKGTALEEARRLCEPCTGPGTRLLAIINGLDIEDVFAAWIAPNRVFGGMAFVGINRGEPGTVHHIAYGQVTVGNAADDPAANADLAALLTAAGVEALVAPNLRAARWEKLAWNVPFNGLSVANGGLGVASILHDPRFRAVAEAVMREVLATGNADLRTRGSETRMNEGETVATLFRLSESLGEYRTSMTIDLEERRPLEVESIHGAVLRRAIALNIGTPALAELYGTIKLVDPAGR